MLSAGARLGQILLLAAGFLVLVAISVGLGPARQPGARRQRLGGAHRRGRKSDQCAAARNPPRRKRRARLSADLGAGLPARPRGRRAATSFPTPTSWRNLIGDNPVQVETSSKLRPAVEAAARPVRAAKWISSSSNDRRRHRVVARSRRRQYRRHDPRYREGDAGRGRPAVRRRAPRRADRTPGDWPRCVTIAGSGLVIALAGISIFLVRRSSRARDEAEAKLRDNNLNLEATVDERTADLREANDEIQRFAYIVSHDLRSPLVNIMGFTSELEELRDDIFRRIAALARAAVRRATGPGKRHRYRRARARRRRQAAFAGLLRSARIHQILDRQDGPADIGDPQPHPRRTARVRAGTDRYQAN